MTKKKKSSGMAAKFDQSGRVICPLSRFSAAWGMVNTYLPQEVFTLGGLVLGSPGLVLLRLNSFFGHMAFLTFF